MTISVRTDGFLYKMVRSIVGGLVKVGEGKLSVEQLRALMAGKKRTALVETAPAHGLFLWKVFLLRRFRLPGMIAGVIGGG